MPIEEEKRVKIKEEAKEILSKFSRTLSGVKAKESNVERDNDRREEKEGEKCDSNFRDIMFENAPRKNKDFIIAEKKKW